MKTVESIQTYSSGSFPNTLAINSSGAATPDGTEYIAAQINNFIFGPAQAIMDYASITPDGVTEAAGASQLLEAYGKAYGVGPGVGVIWWLFENPSTTGHRVLLLSGQGVLIASYPELTAAVYVGDAFNAAAAAAGGGFYKASDAAGTTPDTAGPYLILPDTRGYVLRGLDTSAAVDPDGASRWVGGIQTDAMQGHIHPSTNALTRTDIATTGGGVEVFYPSAGGALTIGSPTTDGVSGTPRTAVETRMVNTVTKFGITY